MSGIIAGDIDNSNSQSTQLVILNVGGKKFYMAKESLDKFPDSRLGALVQLCHDRKAVEEADLCSFVLSKSGRTHYGFARSSAIFESIAQLYYTGTFHFGVGLCAAAVKDELSYWGLSDLQPDDVCPSCTTFQALPPLYKPELIPSPHPACTRIGQFVPSRADCTLPRSLFEGHEGHHGLESVENGELEEMPSNTSTIVTKSTLAFHMVTFSLILTNIAIMILDSLPDYHWSSPTVQLIEFIQSRFDETVGNSNATSNGRSSQDEFEGLPIDEHHLSSSWMIGLRMLDWFCSIWFTMEFLVRFYLAKFKGRFICQILTIIDLLAIFPTYIELVIGYVHPSSSVSISGSGFSAFKVLRLFRIFRIFRILKLARYEDSFKALGVCLRNSYRELSLLVMYLLISTVFFGSLLYYAESDYSESQYRTIPVAIWWSLVTYFGYSDAPPVTAIGKVVAGMGAIWGVLFMAFPISILVEKFAQVFRASADSNRVLVKVHDETQSVRLKTFVSKIPTTAHF